jgi:hypothetical protein
MHETDDPEFWRYLDKLRALPDSEKRNIRIEIYTALEDASYVPEVDPAEWTASRELRKRRGIEERKAQ